MLLNDSVTVADIGVCLSTLVPDPRALSAADIEDVLHSCHALGVNSLVSGLAFVHALGADRMRELCRELGLRIRVLEAVVAWVDGAEKAREEMQRAASVATAIGADTVMAATVAESVDYAQALQGFVAACELARSQGLRVDLEFIPRTAVPDLETAWHIVRDSRAENAGLVIDCLHWFHQPGGPDFALLRSIPAPSVRYVQLCDSPRIATPEAGQYVPFSLRSRLPPGQGCVDIGSILTTLEDMGAAPYFAFEVYNAELAANGPSAVLESCIRSVHRASFPPGNTTDLPGGL